MKPGGDIVYSYTELATEMLPGDESLTDWVLDISGREFESENDKKLLKYKVLDEKYGNAASSMNSIATTARTAREIVSIGVPGWGAVLNSAANFIEMGIQSGWDTEVLKLVIEGESIDLALTALAPSFNKLCPDLGTLGKVVGKMNKWSAYDQIPQDKQLENNENVGFFVDLYDIYH